MNYYDYLEDMHLSNLPTTGMGLESLQNIPSTSPRRKFDWDKAFDVAGNLISKIPRRPIQNIYQTAPPQNPRAKPPGYNADDSFFKKYKTPLLIGGGLIVGGIVLYMVTKKK
tara:strand:+ start:5644 stop:5979 length:336 start_codon:yes stop_codon:yes gene_type:complete